MVGDESSANGTLPFIPPESFGKLKPNVFKY